MVNAMYLRKRTLKRLFNKTIRIIGENIVDDKSLYGFSELVFLRIVAL